MSFFLFLLYLVVTYIFPGELFAALQPYRITFWIGLLGLAVSVLTLAPAGKLTIRTLPLALIAGLVLSMMLSVMWADKWLGAPLAVIQKFGPALTLFLLAIWNVNSLRRLRITVAALVLLSMVVVAQGVAAYHLGFMQDKLLFRGSANQDNPDESAAEANVQVRIRSFGQMNDPNDLALVLASTLPLLGLAWKQRRIFRNILLLGPPAAFLIYGVFLTRSRGGMLGVLAVVFAGLAGRVSRTKALLATAVMAVIFVGANFTGGREISTSEESAAGRLDAWSEGLAMYRSNPILGVGFQNFTEHHELTAHNSFVLSFAELGTIGYFFWLALLVVAILQLEQVRHCSEEDFTERTLRRYPQVLLASLSSMLVTAFFLSRSYNPILYLLVGLAAALYAIARTSEYPVALPSLNSIGWRVGVLELASIFAIYLLVRMNRLFL